MAIEAHGTPARRRPTLLLVVAAALLLSRAAAADSPSSAPGDGGRCLTCHGMANLSVRDSASALHDFSVQPAAFGSSVHGRLSCEQCHQDIGAYPHRFVAGRAKVTCAQDCHARDEAGRAYTHQAAAADFDASVHRSGASGNAADRPSCLTCHGSGNAHLVARAKFETPRARMDVCVRCHDDRARMTRAGVELDAVSSYKRSFHYKAIVFGGRQAAVCQDCHSAHRILKASDPQSSVAAAALPATCGRSACHPGARANFAVSGANHLDLRVRREPLLFAEERMFRLLTSGTMAMLVVGIVLDIQKRFGWLALAMRAAARSAAVMRAAAGGGRHAVRIARRLLVE